MAATMIIVGVVVALFCPELIGFVLAIGITIGVIMFLAPIIATALPVIITIMIGVGILQCICSDD